MEKALGMVLLLSSTVSAQTGERIIGGSECLPHSQPWHVFMYNSQLTRCGGALIDEHWVVTAGHCLGSTISIHLGEHDVRKEDEGEQYSSAVQIIRHAEFEPESLKNDIMLLRLDPPATLGDTIKIIPMATECAPTGTNCVVSGWGTTTYPEVNYANTLNCMDTTILEKDICTSTYGSDFTENEICAGKLEGGIDSCQGDSGSPMICNGVLHGIVSWGANECGEKQKPAIYTEICKFRKWIDETIARK
ncbi:kallikrein-8-like [Hemicordylus capensis]|uniref:kallikrein-8-like n=1 Tax=Hemicordylus capensis TaxID=884348 RepID=UPI002303F47B|nr:kallikrein-8-like [Hemicordylus capensis]